MEQPIPVKDRRVSESEYLRLEEISDVKHEFRNGEILDRAGGTFEHAAVAANLIGELGNRLRGKPCKPLGSDARVRIPATGNYSYPDVSIVCGPPVFDPPDRRTTIANPQVVIEVTSASSESLDRTDKFSDYMRIGSLQEYILVSQERPRVDLFYRQTDGIWAIGASATKLEESLTIASLNLTIPLAEIYNGIDWSVAQNKDGSIETRD